MRFWKSLLIGRAETKIWRGFKVKCACLYESIYRHECMQEQRPRFSELKDGPFQFYVPMIALYIFFHPLTTLLMLHLWRSMTRISFNPSWSECDYVLVWQPFCLCTYQFFSPFPQIPCGIHHLCEYFTTLVSSSLQKLCGA